jgi:hypothetical protein
MFKSLPDVLKAVTDPFSLLALIVLVLGWIAHSTIKSAQKRSEHPSSWPPLVSLSIVAVSFLALAFNVLRVSSLQKAGTTTTTGTKYTLQVTFVGAKKRREPVTVPFRTSSGQLNVGCGDSASTSASWNIPAGARDINTHASWERTDNLKGQTQQSSANGNVASAAGTIAGQDRQWTGNCPGGGHGELVLSGTYVIDQDASDERVALGTFQDTVPEGGQAKFPIPMAQGAILQSCVIRITSTSTNLVGSETLPLRTDENGQAWITTPPPTDLRIKTTISGRELVIAVP